MSAKCFRQVWRIIGHDHHHGEVMSWPQQIWPFLELARFLLIIKQMLAAVKVTGGKDPIAGRIKKNKNPQTRGHTKEVNNSDMEQAKGRVHKTGKWLYM